MSEAKKYAKTSTKKKEPGANPTTSALTTTTPALDVVG
jgi:hypothetical protein